MKNITLSADERLIEAARARARAENSTLNEQFRIWLEHYSQRSKRLKEVHAALESFADFQLPRKFSREEMNER